MNELATQPSDDLVQWQTSSQLSSRPEENKDIEALDLASSTPNPRKSEHLEKDVGASFLEKYNETLGSSPPSTWAGPRKLKLDSTPVAAKRHRSDITPISNRKLYKYSPGYLKDHGKLSTVTCAGSPEQKKVKRPESLQTPQCPSSSPKKPNCSFLSPQKFVAPPILDDLDDFDDDEPPHPDLWINLSRPNLHRYVVCSITRQPNGELHLGCKHTKGFSMILLRQTWSRLTVKDGDIIHILGDYPLASLSVTVDHASQFLVIVQPDILVPCTSVADSMSCNRSVILKSRSRVMGGEISVPMTYGKIIHEAIQMGLMSGDINRASLTAAFKTLIGQYIEDFAYLEVTAEQARIDLDEKIPSILQWAQNYVRAQGAPSKAMSVYRSSKHWEVAIRRAAFTEYDVWSPVYGIKGKLDAVVEVSTTKETLLAALEVKTGRHASNGHRAQSLLYTILLQERFGSKAFPWSILYYSQHGNCTIIPFLMDECRALLQKRNELACYLKDLFQLPPLISDSHTCSHCNVKAHCAVYSAAFQEMDMGDYDGMEIEKIGKEYAGHLSGAHLEFFEHWDNLLTLESVEIQNKTKRAWCMPPAEKEEKGIAFCNVKMNKLLSATTVGISRTFVYEMTRDRPFPVNTSLSPGSSIVLNTREHIGWCQGLIKSLTATKMIISVDQELTEDEDYSLDYLEFGRFTAFSRGNLLSMFDPEFTRLLDLIVDLKPPRFSPELPLSIPSTYNTDQRSAMTKVLTARDYAIIRGMPGTGKTTTIVAIVEALVRMGKSVLVSAYTHSAVDNICLKLFDKKISLLRLGHVASIHKDVRKATAGYGKIATTREELEDIYMKPLVIATTSLSLGSWVFSKRRFDYCIMDEASQLTLPACIGPLKFADKFVLVGDDFQLTPLVKSEKAKAGGLSTSLFKYLADRYPCAVVNLSHQYRMNSDIMRLSSELVYNGELKCATRAVANQRLHLPKFHPDRQYPKWLDPENPVIFFNTDSFSDAGEVNSREGYCNPREADIARKMVGTFVTNGLPARDIGVISVYSAQVRELSDLEKKYEGVEVLTADKAQGRDKECIIISLVRSNNNKNVGILLRDWRRINVVFTRAKCKLIIIGSRQTLMGAPALEKFIKVMDKHKWVHEA